MFAEVKLKRQTDDHGGSIGAILIHGVEERHHCGQAIIDARDMMHVGVAFEARELHFDQLDEFARGRQRRRSRLGFEQAGVFIAHRFSLPTGTLGIGEPVGEPKIRHAH